MAAPLPITGGGCMQCGQNDRKKRGLLYLFFIPFQSSFKRGDKMTEFSGAHERWKKRREEMQSAGEEERAEHKIKNKYN